MGSYLLLIIAALAAGLINSVAGGACFLPFPHWSSPGFPRLLPMLRAPRRSFPGSWQAPRAYREDFRKSGDFPFVYLLIVSLVGGVVGALLLLFTPQRTFDSVIPWLLLAATLLFTFGPKIAPRLKCAFHMSSTTLIVIQFFIGIYGGYFGGAIGILMLATWTIYGLSDIHVMNANRTLMGAATNSIAAVLFVVARKIWWPQTLVMLVGAVAGGYLGARMAKRVNPRYIRAIVTVVSVGITVAFFLRRH